MNFKLATIVAASFAAGSIFGSLTMRNAIQMLLNRRQELLANALTSVIKMAIDEKLQPSEVQELINQELDFLIQIMPET